MNEILNGLFAYYGLDWLTMIFGLAGAYFLVRRNSFGFVFNVLSCIAALSVAMMSGQYGFIVYNSIYMLIAAKGYLGWRQADVKLS